MAEGSIWEAFAARQLREPRQPDRDHRRQPPGPDRRDDATAGTSTPTRTASAPSAGTRSRSTATTSRRSTAPTPRPMRPRASRPRSSPAPVKGKGVAAVENKNGFHGKPLDDARRRRSRELGGLTQHPHRLHRQARGARQGRTRSRTPAAKLPTLRHGCQGRHAQGLRRRARGARRGRRRRRRARRRGGQLDLHAKTSPRPIPRALLRDVHRRAADGRPPRSDCRCAAGSRSRPRSRRS